MTLGFTSAQLERITAAAEPLSPEKRDVFLKRLAAFLEVRGIYRHARDDDVEAAVRSSLSGLLHGTAA